MPGDFLRSKKDLVLNAVFPSDWLRAPPDSLASVALATFLAGFEKGRMPDEISRLCFRLIRAEDPDQLSPVAAELQEAIRDRFNVIRGNALEIALLDRLVTYHVPGSDHGCQPKENNRN